MPSLGEFIASTQSAALQAILRHWHGARGASRLPSFDQLRLYELSSGINRMWVYRYDRRTGSFTGRLAGDQIARAFGKDFQGMPLEQAHSAKAYLWVHRTLTRIVTEPAIYRSAGTLYHQAGLDIQGERIGLPLADDGINCDGVLGVSDYQDPNLTGPFELLTEKETWLSLQ
jgi:hypothetical protein